LLVIADEPQKTHAEAPAASVQQQLDELRQGQQQLRGEIEEIKKLLQGKPARTDFASKPAAPTVTSVNVYREPFRGTNTARIGLIEYSDFDCSYCGIYARNIFPRVDAEYVTAGKVRYFFRDLPEPKQTNAWLKARAARCAGDQGKFWEMHDRLFAAQEASGQDLSALAQILGLDLERFNQCLSTGRYLENIQLSADSARRMGIFGTPAFLIGTLSEDGGFLSVKKVLVGAGSGPTSPGEVTPRTASPFSVA
jgi:protein-disulfide isomerase